MKYIDSNIKVEIKKENRKNVRIKVKDGVVYVAAPLIMTNQQLQDCLEKDAEWITNALHKDAQRQAEKNALSPFTSAELRSLAQKARLDIPPRVAHYAPLVGVDYGSITIRAQKTRWGSCSAQRNLNFNCLLMLAPERVRDAIVVHELCHLKEMNHSAAFYKEVYRVFPGYDSCNRWLKNEGATLIRRLRKTMDN